ncbi:hypothetical protein ACE6H2_010950 [Prunus campanulata]
MEGTQATVNHHLLKCHNRRRTPMQEICTSTTSMTSILKPLKYLRPHYGTLKTFYETMADSYLKAEVSLNEQALKKFVEENHRLASGVQQMGERALSLLS